MERKIFKDSCYEEDDLYHFDFDTSLFDIDKKAFFGLGMVIGGLVMYGLRRFKLI